MSSTTTDRIDGLTASVAIKAPVRVAASSNITLSGLQTIDGVALEDGDRVLAFGQTSAIENGIYIAKPGQWVRSKDFDGNRDVVGGTLVWVAQGTVRADTFFRVGNSGAVTIDVTEISFVAVNGAFTGTFTSPAAGAVARSVSEKFEDVVSVKDFGAVGDGVTDDTSAIQAAIDHAKTSVETILANKVITVTAAVYIPAGTYSHTGLTTYSGIRLEGAGQGSTTLKYTGSGIGIAIEKVSTEELFAVQFANFTLWDQGTGTYGVSGNDGQPLAIRSCSMDAVTVAGFDTNVFLVDCWTFATKNCHFYNAGSYNLRIQNGTAQQHENTRFDIAGVDSVLIENSSAFNTISPLFIGCAFQGAGQWGLRAIGVASLSVINPFFEDNANDGASYGCMKIEAEVGKTTTQVQVLGGYFTATGGNAGQTAVSIEEAEDVVIDTTISSSFTAGTGYLLGSDVENARLLGYNAANTQVSGTAARLTTRFQDEGWQFNENILAETLKSAAEFTIADDAVKTIALSASGTRGIILIAGNGASAEHAVVAFRVGDSAHISLLGNTANVTASSSVLAGTTGADGDLTISATNTNNNLYIENRTGAQRAYTITLLSISGGSLSSIT